MSVRYRTFFRPVPGSLLLAVWAHRVRMGDWPQTLEVGSLGAFHRLAQGVDWFEVLPDTTLGDTPYAYTLLLPALLGSEVVRLDVLIDSSLTGLAHARLSHCR